VGLAVAAVGGLSVVGYVAAVAATAPAIDELEPKDKGRSSEILAADGSRLGYVVSDEIRTPVPAREQTRDLRAATVAIEDERFWSHSGVDYEGIVRAGVANVQSGETVQGGSTITQQLVRALYIKDPQRNVERKIREAKLASELEKERSKQWILKEYLNSVPYGTAGGRTALGVEAAASVYFSKRARDLTLAESAMLAGLPQAPSQYNPFRNPAAARSRRDEVLRRMVKVCQSNRCAELRRRVRRALRSGLGLKRGDRYTKRREPHFFDFVQEQLIEEYGASVYRRGGLTIHTTIDPKMQAAGRRAINNQLSYPGDPSGAVVAIDPSTGYIRAMASSGTYDDRTFNLAAQGHRQPGSAFKTMVLTTAIRRGVNPRTTFYNSKPLQLQIPGYGPYKVQTYDKSYGGRMDLVKATLKSDNTVYAQLDVDLGPKEVAETAKLMGITTKLDGIPSEGLGGLRLGVSPLEMANAYATLAAGGMRSKPKAIRRVEFSDGKSDDLGKPQRKRVFPDGVAWEVTKILKANVEKGTGTKASTGCPSAGKTGTTDNFNDAWFVGYTPKLAASVWVGYPAALKEMRGVHGIDVAGGTFPASIWGNFMREIRPGCRGFSGPSNPVSFTPFYGKYASQGPAQSESPGQSATGTGTGTNPGYNSAPPQGGGVGGGGVGGGGGGAVAPSAPSGGDTGDTGGGAPSGGGTDSGGEAGGGTGGATVIGE
jgi:penicillin-binding protein 1A